MLSSYTTLMRDLKLIGFLGMIVLASCTKLVALELQCIQGFGLKDGLSSTEANDVIYTVYEDDYGSLAIFALLRRRLK